MTRAGNVARVMAGGRMPIAVNEQLAHLLQVQGGLLDAYLEQNLGKRYAYVILAWEQAPPAQLRGVTNLQEPQDARDLLRDFADRVQRLDGDPLALERGPTFLDAEL